jgi:hypothetical protein
MQDAGGRRGAKGIGRRAKTHKQCDSGYKMQGKSIVHRARSMEQSEKRSVFLPGMIWFVCKAM